MKKIEKLKIWQLVLILILVVGGSVLFVGMVSGWFFDKRAELDSEYLCGDNCDGEYMELSIEAYEDLIRQGKSFVVVIDQGGCKTADRVKRFGSDYMKEKGIKIYKMMFEEMKETSLHDFVKYYPSVAVISQGSVIGYLKADADEDAPSYNDYEAFRSWIEKYLK